MLHRTSNLRALIHTVVNLRVTCKVRNLVTVYYLLKKDCSMDLDS